jgi:hypothetical protein
MELNDPPLGFTFMYFPKPKVPFSGALEKRNSIRRKENVQYKPRGRSDLGRPRKRLMEGGGGLISIWL